MTMRGPTERARETSPSQPHRLKRILKGLAFALSGVSPDLSNWGNGKCERLCIVLEGAVREC